MLYPKEAYEKVNELLSVNRLKATLELQARREKIQQELPEVLELESKIDEIGLAYSRQAFQKNSDPEKMYEQITSEISQLKEKLTALLKKNGLPPDYLNNAFTCKKCGDTGFIQGKMCSCMLDMLTSYSYQTSNLSMVMEQQNFTNFNLDYYSDQIAGDYPVSPRKNMEQILVYIDGYLKNFSTIPQKNLYIYGGAGLGKTFLCSCIAKELIGAGFDVYYQSAYALFELASRNKFNSNENYDAEIARSYACDLLILDDLGTEFATQYTVSFLFHLLNTRMMQNRPIIINSNLTLSEVEQKYSSRIASRFMEFQSIRLIGEDIRAKKHISHEN